MYEEQDALYRLLPAYLRVRDKEGEGPLKELLAIIRRQAYLIEEDIVRRMYDDWFVETCQDWVLPYIGDLLGYQRMPASMGDSRTLSGRRLAKVLSPRREIGNLIAYRRRKGTLWLLEELARDVADWPGCAVEFYRLLSRTEHLDHPLPTRLAVADIRNAESLELIGSPFDNLCYTVDVRRISSGLSAGRYNIPNIGLFVFRTKRYPVTRTPAYCREDKAKQCFTFSILGNDTPLLRLPLDEFEPASLAKEANFALPIRYRSFRVELKGGYPFIHANDPLYGEEKSLAVYAPDWPKKGQGFDQGKLIPISAEKVIPADLSQWAGHVPKNCIAVDPVLGRIKFPKGQVPERVMVSYGYGFSADMGGGEYDRPTVPLPSDTVHFRVGTDLGRDQPEQRLFKSIDSAYRYWQTSSSPEGESSGGGQGTKRPPLLIELMESGIYKGRIKIELEAGEFVCLRAGKRTRPILWLSDENPDGSDSIFFRGKNGSRIILDGLLVTGRGVEINGPEPAEDERPVTDNDLCEVVIRHSTLVPGWSSPSDCEPRRSFEPSIVINNSSTQIRVEASIVGPIQINTDPLLFDPTPVTVCDSVIDATSNDNMAIADDCGRMAYAQLRIARTTIVGKVLTHAVLLAENSLFTAQVHVARKQMGCIRYSHVPVGSRTPRRHRCQPESDQVSLDEAQRLTPCFDSTYYGTANYLRLSPCTAVEIRKGADDESEMGVYHDLFEPQRFELLTRRLEEFVTAGSDSAVIFAS
jgi:hypothetical protein